MTSDTPADAGSGWVDSHCHVYDERMPGGPDGAVAEARAAGVGTMIAVGCDRETSLAALACAGRHDDVHATVGLHPHEARHGVDSVADLIDPTDPRLVAVGECGLDYYYDHSPRDVQQQVFAEQIAIAHARSLPLVIHTRDAWDDTFSVLATAGVPTPTIFHCFTGGPAEAERALALGPEVYLSIPGIVTFKNSDDLRAAAAIVPADRLLIETDAPYLAPVPFRGKRNQPAYVVHTAQFLADLRDEPLAALAATTTANARRAFRIS